MSQNGLDGTFVAVTVARPPSGHDCHLLLPIPSHCLSCLVLQSEHPSSVPEKAVSLSVAMRSSVWLTLRGKNDARTNTSACSLAE